MSKSRLSMPRCCIVLTFLLACISSVMAQGASPEPPEDMGLKPFGAYHAGNFDSVSISNGNLFVKIPLFSIPQRGSTELSYSLYYNTRHAKTYKTICPGNTLPPVNSATLLPGVSDNSCTTLIAWMQPTLAAV